ncbi:MAG: hypothetical protein JSW07_00280 [bacterium]|nr:MAG: hypothetical protein JSW07_00280 [bacterium]
MALSLGTNCGFVTEAPEADPDGSAAATSGRSRVLKDTSPATAIKVTEIGWWADNATQEANFEVAIYNADGVVVPGEAGTMVDSDTTNAKGTDAGWKRCTGLNISIESSTDYWIAIQCDFTVTSTNIDYSSSGGSGYDYKSEGTLNDPYGGGALADADGMLAIYAVWEAAAGGNAGIMTTNTGYWGPAF